MATVPFATVRKQFSAFIRRVEAGEEIIITRRGKPAARLAGPNSPMLGTKSEKIPHDDGDGTIIGKRR